MIELDYENLQPAQKANVIAGKRMGSRKKTAAEVHSTSQKKPNWS
jgi:hypothetical protein